MQLVCFHVFQQCDIKGITALSNATSNKHIAIEALLRASGAVDSSDGGCSGGGDGAKEEVRENIIRSSGCGGGGSGAAAAAAMAVSAVQEQQQQQGFESTRQQQNNPPYAEDEVLPLDVQLFDAIAGDNLDAVNELLLDGAVYIDCEHLNCLPNDSS